MKENIVLDHTSLIKTYDDISGSKIKKLSKSVDMMFRAMSRRREAGERMVKVNKIFNI